MIKKLMTALLVAAMLFAATSISWGGNGKGNSGGSDGVVNTVYELLGATWE